MATPAVVAQCIRIMWTAQRPGSNLDEETEQTLLATWAPALKDYSDDAVKMAANEWMQTSLFLPKPVEFVEVVRRQAQRVADRRALGVGGLVPARRAALGKEGSEGLAAVIVTRKMLREVGRVTPLGYAGRWAGLSGDRNCGHGLVESGHSLTAGLHDEDCERCWLLAAVAYEQAYVFPGSSLTAESWLTDPPAEATRSCRNEACDHGWVTVTTMENARVVERQHKCPTCEGPKAPRAQVSPEASPGQVKVTRARRRRS